MLVEDIKNNLELINNTRLLLTEYFGETLLRPQGKVAELRLIDPLLDLTVGYTNKVYVGD